MSLLTLVQDFCSEVGIPQPTSVVGSSDPQIQQILALLNRTGRTIARAWEWQKLVLEGRLTTVATSTTGDLVNGSAVVQNIPSTAGFTTSYGVVGLGIRPFTQIQSIDSPTQVTLTLPATQTQVGQTLQFSQVQYDLPADWLKEIPQTEWDRSNRWPLIGPVSSQTWQSFKSGIVYAGPRARFRIQNQQIFINPPPANGFIYAYEYQSQNWVLSASGTGQAKFLADTDTHVFDESLLISGLKAQWFLIKGFDASSHLAEFNTLLDMCKAQDKSAPKLSLAPTGGDILLTNKNLPDGSWNVS